MKTEDTEDRRVCPSCGNEFSGAVEFCPVCMLQGASLMTLVRESFSEQALKRDNRKTWDDDLSTLNLSRAKTGNLSSWVAARWA